MKRSISSLALLGIVVLAFVIEVQALTLGRLRVVSSLGQPLIAEIEVPEISQDEANTLRIAIASPEAFRTAGLDYNPVVAGLTIAGKRRSDGRAVLELRSSQSVNEPFLDLVLEITWSTGRMVRDYTLLLDPSTATPSAPAVVPAPTLPLAAASPSPAPDAGLAQGSPVNTGQVPAISQTPASSIATSVQAAPISAAMPSQFSVKTEGKAGVISAKGSNESTKTKPKSANKSASKNQVVVKKGDTAAAIAANMKPEGVSLDQMLIALLRNNPDAFVDGNVNRLKSGVVLDIPSDEEAARATAAQAKNSIQVQARDFNDYRRKLAGIVSTAPAVVAKRESTGKMVAKVEDKKPSAAAPDKLTLSKPPAGSDIAASAKEDKIAKERAASDAAARAAELKKNIADLEKIAPPAPAATGAGAGAGAGGAPAVAPTTQPNAAPLLPGLPTGAVAPPETVASSPAQPASEPLARPAAAPATPPKASPSLLTSIISHPWVMPIAGGLAALLALLGLLRLRNKRRDTDGRNTVPNTMSFPVTRQPSDTVFGAVGSSRVDTQETMGQPSTMVYAPSQLATASGDVDPVAEADVYLAYNRDVQAEEILKEAKRNTPNRTDIHVKLLEVYAKRRDVEAFDALAQELHLITDGGGDHWMKARDLAKEAGSASTLFQVAGAAFQMSESPLSQSPYNNNSLSFTPASAGLFQLDPVASAVPVYEAPSPTPVTTAQQPLGGSSGLIDFDLSALTLDLPSAPSYTSSTSHSPTEPLLDSKLALAEEYLSIGDKAGARGLIEDVLAHGAPDAVAQAQAMLARMG